MKYLPQLTENEIRYICSVIPKQDTIIYFQHNPKEFSIILPGFRPNAISKINVSNLLFNHRNQGFIAFYIEEHVKDWLAQIREQYNHCIEDGDSKELALIHTLPFCFFADNISLYFKLMHEECSKEYFAILSLSVKSIKESYGKQEKLLDELKNKESDITKLRIEYELARTDLDSKGIKLIEHSAEIKILKREISGLEKLIVSVQEDKEIIASFKSKVLEQEGTIQKLREELSDEKDSLKKLEAHIWDELKKQQVLKIEMQQIVTKPKRPNDIEEFKEYLGYNLENIGITANAEYYALLKEHLSKILFHGVPIVINQIVGLALMKCVANTLIGQSNVKTLTYSKEHSAEDINNFLSTCERVVCLNNFIGNFNETELLPLFDRHRDKIIFLTVFYDRTINYVSKEFLRYCHYLNLNRIAALSNNTELTEDPAKIDEVDCEPTNERPNNQYSNLLREILVELGYLRSLAEQKCAVISSEQDLCRMLAFDVLPYCVDVLQIAPYNTSDRFLKYAGDTGRSPYKNLFKRWFA